MILLNLYNEEANHGEKVALKFRWILFALVFVLIFVVMFNGNKQETIASAIIASLFGIYNLILIYLFHHGKVYPWVRYLSVSLDIGLLSAHIYTLSVFISPFAVATTATMFLYPVMMFLSVLRYDKKLITYTIIFALFSFNLTYFLRYPYLDQDTMSRIISTDSYGQAYKSLYLLLYGILLFHIPNLVNRVMSRYAKIAEEKKKSEMQLTLEVKENEYIEDKLQYAKLINAQLNEKNEQIAAQNEMLKEMNATKDRLFSIIGHDLKNPFTVLISLSQMIKDQLEHLDTEDLKKSLNVMYSASSQGLALLDNLLDWARSQTGEITFAAAPVRLGHSVKEVLVQIEPFSARKHVTIQTSISDSHIVTADRNMLQTIFRNLISNAIKFSETGGKVIIDSTLDESANKTMISVTDHGVGIPEENLANLFNIKDHQTTKGTLQESGTGLGLLICKEFIEKHGGNIQVYSTIGEGTRITFDLPSIRQ